MSWDKMLFRLKKVIDEEKKRIPTVDEYLFKLREDGWTIAVHNDYRLNNVSYTFYLFTHPLGIWTKGEGLTDIEALQAALTLSQVRYREAVVPRLMASRMVNRLRHILAMAINQINGQCKSDRLLVGSELRDLVVRENLIDFDNHRHTDDCPANHYNRTRLPTGLCNCKGGL